MKESSQTPASSRAGGVDERRVSTVTIGVVTIETVLDSGLPPKFEKDVYDAKRQLVFNQVHDSYMGKGRSIFSMASTVWVDATRYAPRRLPRRWLRCPSLQPSTHPFGPFAEVDRTVGSGRRQSILVSRR